MAVNENLIKIFEYALNQEETGKAFFESSLERMGIGSAISAFKSLRPTPRCRGEASWKKLPRALRYT